MRRGLERLVRAHGWKHTTLLIATSSQIQIVRTISNAILLRDLKADFSKQTENTDERVGVTTRHLVGIDATLHNSWQT